MVALSTPLWGIITDKFGKRLYFILFSFIVDLLAFIVFLIEPEADQPSFIAPMIPLIMQGLFLGIFAACIWPCTGILIKPEIIGTAYSFVYVL